MISKHFFVIFKEFHLFAKKIELERTNANSPEIEFFNVKEIISRSNRAGIPLLCLVRI